MNEQHSRSVSESAKAEIAAAYLGGENGLEISARYGIGTTTVYSALRKMNVSRRSKVEAHRKYSVDESCFDTITPESAYWIGFLMADGSVFHQAGASWRLSLQLSVKDEEHVERFRRFVKATSRLYRVGSHGTCGPTVMIVISSNRLAEALARYGVVPNKTKSAEVIGLEGNRDFWRGVIDGDGNLGRSLRFGSVRMKLVGSANLTRQFSEFARGIYSGQRATVYKGPSGNYSAVGLSGPGAYAVIDCLYRDCGVALERKRVHAEELLREGVIFRGARNYDRQQQQQHEGSVDVGNVRVPRVLDSGINAVRSVETAVSEVRVA